MVYIRKYGWGLRDKSFRLNYDYSEISKRVLKSFLSSSFYSIFDKMYFNRLLLFFTRYNSLSICRNCCLFSNSSRVVFRRFRLSRHFSKKFASNGYLLGLRKSSF